MRRAMVLLIVIATMMVIPITAEAVTLEDFEGDWTATDLDDSNLTMRLKVTGNKVQMKLYDDAATGCDSENPPTGWAKGFGTLDGDTLVVEGRFRCKNGVHGPITVTFEMTGSDELTANDGVVWTRS